MHGRHTERDVHMAQVWTRVQSRSCPRTEQGAFAASLLPGASDPEIPRDYVPGTPINCENSQILDMVRKMPIKVCLYSLNPEYAVSCGYVI